MEPSLAPVIASALDRHSDSFAQNRADMLEQLGVIDGLLDAASAGGGPEATQRLRERGKMPIRERIAAVLDPDSPFLEISPLAGYGSDYTVGGGMVVGIGVIAGVECVVMGNDPTVLGGALTALLGQEVVPGPRDRPGQPPPLRQLRRVGRRRPAQCAATAAAARMATAHFAESGRFFYDLIELSKLRIPTVCVVFGSSTAGGAYQPGLSDYTSSCADSPRSSSAARRW